MAASEVAGTRPARRADAFRPERGGARPCPEAAQAAALRARMAAAILRAAVAAAAGSVEMPAQAALIGTCTITVLSNGRMTPNAAIDSLSSSHAGGAAAQARVTANSLVCMVLGLLDCYRISAPPPAAFLTYPGGGDAGVSFSSSYRVDGGPDMAGAVQTEVLNGVHTVAVDLSANRASGVFPTGSYQAQVTLRCE